MRRNPRARARCRLVSPCLGGWRLAVSGWRKTRTQFSTTDFREPPDLRQPSSDLPLPRPGHPVRPFARLDLSRAYDHLSECPPCYREVRALQQAAGERRVFAARWAIAAAAILVLAVIGAMFLVSRPDRAAPVSQAPSRSVGAPQTTSAQLNLRRFTVTRSEQNEAGPEPTSIPRARLNLTMLLPVGFEGGDYDVQILDSNLGSKASTGGNAEIRE
jgi:hypothetical protein